jgi:hypothetical protein
MTVCGWVSGFSFDPESRITEISCIRLSFDSIRLTTTAVDAMRIACFAMGMACLGMLMPQGVLAATPPPSSKSVMSDVVLGVRGTLVGQVVDGRGRVLAGRVVSLHRGVKVIARVRTDKSGRFVAENLPGGAYVLKSGSARQVIRAWAAGSAPPRTPVQVVLVDQVVVVRGQAETDVGFLGLDTTGLIIVGAVAVIVPVAIAASNDDDPPVSP